MQHVPYKYTDLHIMRPSCIKGDLLLPRDRQAYSQPKQQHDSAPAKHRHGCRGVAGDVFRCAKESWNGSLISPHG